MYLDTERSLKTIVLPIFERLHKEIKAKAKELKTGASKSAKAVEKARGVTQKQIELLTQQTASFDAAAASKVEQSLDPYILRRGVNFRLNKQVIEENNNRRDILGVQNSFHQFEIHIVQTMQGTLDQFFQVVGGQLDKQRTMYADILANFQRIPPDFEWVNFAVRNDQTLLNPDAPPRSLSHITFPNHDHRSTKPLIEGYLERKSRAVIRGYNSSYYVVTLARYLHEFKDTDDFRRDPSPELSLYLPDCTVGNPDGIKFTVKGKDISSGKVGNAFHSNTELSFKAHTPGEAEKWCAALSDAVRGTIPGPAPSAAAAAGTPVASVPEANEAEQKETGAGAAGENQEHPPAYSEKNEEAGAGKGESSAASPVADKDGQATGTTGEGSSAAAAAAAAGGEKKA